MNIVEVSSCLDKGHIARVPGLQEKPVSIPTGSLALDSTLGGHGWPVGRTSYVYGDQMTGKTTLLYATMAQAQKLGMTVAYIDLRNEFSHEYAQGMGVVLRDLIISGAGAWDRFPWELSGIDLVVADAVDDQWTANKLYGMFRDRTLIAACQVAYTRGRNSPAHLGEVITPTFLKSAVSVRLRPGKPVTGGIEVNASIAEDSYAHPGDIDAGKTKFRVQYGLGIDTTDEIRRLALKFGLIKRAPHSSWYKIGPDRVQGWQAANKLIGSNPAYLLQLGILIRNRMEKS